MKNIFLLFAISLVSIFTFAQCPEGQLEVDLEIATDNWGYEVYWEIVPAGNACGNGTIGSGGNVNVGCDGGGAQNQNSGGYGDNVTINEGTWCLQEGESYSLIYVDDYGDGGAEFNLLINGFPLYSFEGAGNGNTWTFEVVSPPALDAGVYAIHTYGYQTSNETFIEGVLFNYGSDVLNSVYLSCLFDGIEVLNENFDGLFLEGYEDFEFEFSVPLDLSYGDHEITVEIISVNGAEDENANNNSLAKAIVRGDPRPNVIDGYLDVVPEMTVIGTTANSLDTPRDLAFHPTLTRYELWVVNEETESSGGSTTTFFNAGQSDQDYEWRTDGNAWHFMSLPTGIDFGENENFATSPGVYDANHNGGEAFTGPALWSSDMDIYAMPSGGNGSHLDMLHVSPYSQGIAHEVDNVYWVVDGYNNDIVRYDFADDHGPGNSFHGDAIIHRYAATEVQKDPSDYIVSHCFFDKATNFLYAVDNENQRVIRIDANTGVTGSTPSYGPFEAVEDYAYVTNYDWDEVVTEGLDEPAGIAVIENRLLVSDYATGDILIYDISSMPAELLGTIPTGAAGIMGIEIGPEGKIWYADADAQEIVVINGNPLNINGETEQTISFFPNPANDVLNLRLPNSTEQVQIIDLTGRIVLNQSKAFSSNATLAVSNLQPGHYIVVASGKEFVVKSQFTKL
ncbi:MAG: hypothetical protein ACI80P_000256 [Flavobacteriales bacterium]|jgi:hypothetical protein